MKAAKTEFFHRIYGRKKTRIFYRPEDLLDYVLMSAITAWVIYACFGANNPITWISLTLLSLMVLAFPLRHGFALRTPLLLRKPQEALYLILYKVQNLKAPLLFGMAFLLLENWLIYLTPGLPHHTQLMHQIALWSFYVHLIGITAYRTVVLIDHLRKKELVREVLLQTAWSGHISRQRSMVVEILHAYATGLLSHIVLLAPWFLVVTYSKFSAVFVPAVLIVNVIDKVWYTNGFGRWYYRDHWLGHHSELDFLYLHGPHHDALPSGLIGVSGNGPLEGLVRHSVGVPTSLFNPVFASILHTFEVFGDIVYHQYIPTVFPSNKNSRKIHEALQHSVHHMLRLEPYGLAFKFSTAPAAPGEKRERLPIPDSFSNAVGLDEELTGYDWNNPYARKYLELFDKYQR